MLPIRDTIKATSFPAVNWLLIGLNAVVFLFEVSLPPQTLDRLILTFGAVPVSFPWEHPLLLLRNPLPLLTLFTHIFLHGGWFHLLSNMWTLYIFGDNVEDRMGSGRYLVFYLLSGLVAGVTQVAIAPTSQVPAIGASGAIAGVLGAYLLLFPGARVITLIPLFFIPWFVQLSAVIYLGIWFISQLFSGVAALGPAAQMTGVAWWAHIGGFVFGMLAHRLFVPRRSAAVARTYPDEYYPW